MQIMVGIGGLSINSMREAAKLFIIRTSRNSKVMFYFKFYGEMNIFV